ncbi:MAG TPA: DUF721 domain-containing protein [Acidimicrobiales bacterium]|nr:DUF721 domain-containing protein [Acidimicrobiales bacterium]
MPEHPGRRRRRPAGPDTGPRPLTEGLDEALDRLVPSTQEGAAPGALGAVFSRWDEIAGPALARHARPLRLTPGELVVAVDEPAWATQVRSLAGELLRRVGEVAGEAPTQLRVTVRPPEGRR